MGIKEELEKLEEEEAAEEQEEIEQIREQETRDKIAGLYYRIDLIAEYIDNQKGVTTITEQQLKEDERHFRENAKEQAWELKNIELIQEIKELTKQLTSKETREDEQQIKEIKQKERKRRNLELDLKIKNLERKSEGELFSLTGMSTKK